MLLYLNAFITLLIPFLLGLVVLFTILRRRLEFFNFWETLALAFATGWGFHIIIMFLLSLIKIPLTYFNIVLTDLLIILGLLLYSRQTPSPPGKEGQFFPKLGEGFWLLVSGFSVIIGIKFLFVLWSSFIKPVIDPDILQCYALAAKSIFLNGTFFGAPGVGNKPPFPFLSQAWSAIGIHTWNDALLTLPHPFMFVSLLVIFYSVLKRYFNHWYSLVCTFLLSTVPFLVFQVGTAYSDFPQAFYYSIATFYLFLFMKEFNREKEPAGSYLLVSALLLGISVWAKKSGLYYAGINLTVLMAFLIYNRKIIERKDWKIFAGAALLFALIVFPWLSYHQFATFKSYYAEAVPSLAGGAGQLFEPKSQNIIQALLRNSFFEDNWHLLGILFLSALLLYPRQVFSAPRVFLLMIIGLQLAALFILFRFTTLYQFIENETLLNRLTFHFVPVILYFCAEIIGGGEKRLQKKEAVPGEKPN